MDKDLSFVSHIKKLENKLSKSVGILNKVKPFPNASTLLQFYFSIFRSHLQYGIIIDSTTINRAQLTANMLTGSN